MNLYAQPWPRRPNPDDILAILAPDLAGRADGDLGARVRRLIDDEPEFAYRVLLRLGRTDGRPALAGREWLGPLQ